MRELSRREVLAGMGGVALAGFLAACGADQPGPTPSRTTPPAPASSPSPTPSAPSEPDVEVMIGAMLLLGFRGTTAQDATALGDLRERHLGGVLLFSKDLPTGGTRNVTSPDQVRTLTAGLRAESGGPLIVAVDQEGGKVARLGPDAGFPATRSAADLGATGDPEQTRAAADAMAATLADVGVSLNLAPVVDVDTNPTNPIIGRLGRSFSADPDVVTAHAAAFVEAHRAHGVATALKHFPGHGSSTGDSHLGFVDVTATWQPLELTPFRDLVARGLADAVLVAHVLNGQLDPDYPASLSAKTIDGALRGDLGFDGPVITDDLQMGAITQRWGFEEALRRAVLAGADLLTYGNNLEAFDPDLGRRAYETLLGDVRSGVISEDRIAASYRRIARLRPPA